MAIQIDPNTLDPIKFTDSLSEFIRPLEALDEETAVSKCPWFPPVCSDAIRIHREQTSYLSSGASTASGVEMDQPMCLSRLQQIREFLLLEEPPAPFLVQQALGHGVLAGKQGTLLSNDIIV